MSNIIFILLGLAVIAVLISLFAGLFFMGKNTEEDRKRSNKLMQARIAFQGIAILLFIVAVVLSQGS